MKLRAIQYKVLLASLWLIGNVLFVGGFTISHTVNRQISLRDHCRDNTISVTPFQPFVHDTLQIRGGDTTSVSGSNSKLLLFNPAVASLFAGSVAGAVGVGVAFPLDTLKTKAQVMAQEKIKIDSSSSSTASASAESLSMFQLIRLIYKREGIQGFFGGVKGMMLGQALIKSVAFAVNSNTLLFLKNTFPALAAASSLLMAACFAGFVTSFLVAPIERIKIMMQADSRYENEFHCIKTVLETDGWLGLFGRGLGPTLTREVPSYGLYFFMYGMLSQFPFSEAMGALAPLVNGALSGMASWIPVYPVDVVKTLVQNGVGEDADLSSFTVARQLYDDGGIGAFFDGLTPKMLRAAVNHAVTFFVYDIITSALIT